MCIESNVAHNNYDKLTNDTKLQKQKEKSYPNHHPNSNKKASDFHLTFLY